MNRLPELYPSQLHLILARRSARRELVEALIARLALRGAVQVLDGGNSFRAHHLARAVRRQTAAWEVALGRIYIARAFTCYQMATLLIETPEAPLPTLVLDLLATFQDESVALVKRQRLLRLCLSRLRQLSQRATLVISADPRSETPSAHMLDILTQAVDQVWQLEQPAHPEPLRLF